MCQLVRFSLAGLLVVVSADMSNGGSPDLPKIGAAGNRTVEVERVRIIPGNAATASHSHVLIIPGASLQSPETRLARREAVPSALPEVLSATPTISTGLAESSTLLEEPAIIPTVEVLLPPSAEGEVLAASAIEPSVAGSEPAVTPANLESPQPGIMVVYGGLRSASNPLLSTEGQTAPLVPVNQYPAASITASQPVYLPSIIPAMTPTLAGPCATCTGSPSDERFRQYLSIYGQIPFSRSEYEANPGYRQQIAMELVLGQPRPVTIQNTNVTVNNMTASPFLSGYPYGVSPFYGYGFGRIHGRYGFVYPRYRTYVRW
jgi:hypothetical protein